MYTSVRLVRRPVWAGTSQHGANTFTNESSICIQLRGKEDDGKKRKHDKVETFFFSFFFFLLFNCLALCSAGLKCKVSTTTRLETLPYSSGYTWLKYMLKITILLIFSFERKTRLERICPSQLKSFFRLQFWIHSLRRTMEMEEVKNFSLHLVRCQIALFNCMQSKVLLNLRHAGIPMSK